MTSHRDLLLVCWGMWFSCFGTSHMRGDDTPDAKVPDRKWTTLERMSPDHLAQAHADTIQIQAKRRKLPELPGRHDLRAILHAHAEDSTHTGGTRAEMLVDARRAEVSVILLTNHYRPPADFIADSWRGTYDGVLFVPGAEARGFLVYPSRSILGQMGQPLPEFLHTVRSDRGLAFLSHIEERPDHPTDNLDGMEIYNRHADAKEDVAGVLGLLLKMTDATALRELQDGLAHFPDEMLASQNTYPAAYLAKWDRETATRRLTGVAANDCHHNQVLLVKVVDDETVAIGTNVDTTDQFRRFSAALRPGIRELTRGRKPGDVIARLDLDPYYRSFRNASTHILASHADESSVRLALRDGHAYVSHDWMCDPTGFRLVLCDADATPTQPTCILGDEHAWNRNQRLVAEFPAPCHIRLIRNGEAVLATSSDRLEYTLGGPGVYRVEGWLRLDGELRPWIYSNPLYLAAPPSSD